MRTSSSRWPRSWARRSSRPRPARCSTPGSDRKSTRLNSSHLFPYTTLFRSGAVAAARHLFPQAPVVVLARYPHQAVAAERLGATTVIDASASDADVVVALAAVVGATVIPTAAGAMFDAGFRSEERRGGKEES